VNGDTGEVALPQQPVELGSSSNRLDKDADLEWNLRCQTTRQVTMSPRMNTHLVKLEAVQQVVELSVLLALGKLDKVLLKTVQSQFGLVIDVDLERL
jgi:hypothetical protein